MYSCIRRKPPDWLLNTRASSINVAVNILWAVTILDSCGLITNRDNYDDLCCVTIGKYLNDNSGPDYMNIYRRMQMINTWLIYGVSGKSDRLSQLLLESKKIVCNGKKHADISSVHHLRVADVLVDMGVKLENEVMIEGISFDIFIRESRTVMEINGIYHYLWMSHVPNGKTIFKERLAEALGFRMTVVPHWEWNELRTSEDQQKYLMSLLLK